MPSPPELAFAFEAHVAIGPPLEVGPTVHGHRRIIPITGGHIAGPGISGRVVPGGADWQVQRADGITEIHARYTLETDDGALISVVNRGIRHAPAEVQARLNAGEAVDPSRVYFRTVPTFETAAPAYAW